MEERNQCHESRIPPEKAEEFKRCLQEAGELQKTILTALEAFPTNIKTHNGTHFAAQSIKPVCLDGDSQLLERNSSTVSVMALLKNEVQVFLEVTVMFEKAHGILEGLVCELSSLVNKWKSEYQLYYAKLLQEPELEEIALWCACAGKMIYDFLHEHLIHYKNVLQNNNCYNKLETAYLNLWSRFIECTFLVCKQENMFVKTETKKFPMFTVRALAADHLNNMTSTVTAHFIRECELRKCSQDDNLDLEMVKAKEIKLAVVNKKQKPSSKHELKSEKEQMQCSFSNLQFEKPFKRQQTKGSKFVHEEKFRMVFVTKMESRTYWTVSLPLVVISASSQEVNGLASIMWQCFSTNVYSLQESTPENLPLSKVISVLVKMLLTICPSHQLTEENINHLKYRLLGEEKCADEKLVSLNQFCCENMFDVKLTFWKWFLGVYNLVEHLKKYWNDGLIMGFVKRDVAEEMLKPCDRHGTFILRFSDLELLTDGDGLRNVCGKLTAAVLCKKLKPVLKTAGNKRKSDGGSEDGGKDVEHIQEKDVEHVHIKKCPPKNLANVLRKEPKPLYCYLYPSGKSPADTFYKYLEDEKRKPTLYKSTSDLDVKDLEQDMRKLDLESKTESLSIGVDSSCRSGPRATKIARRCEKRSECDSSLSDFLSPISSPTQSQLNLSQTSSLEQSPCFMENSPAQSVPAICYLSHERSQDSVVPGSPNKVGLAKDPKELYFEAENDMVFKEYYEEEFHNQHVRVSLLSDPFISGENEGVGEFDIAGMYTGTVNEGLSPEVTYKTKEDNSEPGGEVFQGEAMNSEEKGIDTSGNDETGNEVMEATLDNPNNFTCYNGTQLDPLVDKDLEELIKKTRMLKKNKPEQYNKFLSIIKEDVNTMETDCLRTEVNDSISQNDEDRVLNLDESDYPGLEDLDNINLSPFARLMEEVNQSGI